MSNIKTNIESKNRNIYENKKNYIIKNYENNWLKLNVNKNDLQLKYCFLIGQEFFIKEVEYNTYIGPINKKIFLFKETDEYILYQCLLDDTFYSNNNNKNNCIDKKIYENELINFFNLDFPLNKYIQIWNKKDKRMKEISNKFKGIRVIKTDPTEAFFSFICSTNNNIPRISLMIECLKQRYGSHLATIIFTNKDIIIEKNEIIEQNYNLNKIKKEVYKDKNIKKINENFIKIKKELNENNIKIKTELNEDKENYENIKKINENNIKIKTELNENNENFINKIETNDDNKNIIKEKEIYYFKNIRNEININNKLFYEYLKTNLKKEKEKRIFYFYSFPSIETLSELKETDLRDLGFGFRSKYIIISAKMLKEYGDKWIENLKNEKKTINCINKLIKFPGIGLKVANCICLFGLNKYDCIPIDTHIYNIIYKYHNYIIEKLEKDKRNKQKEEKTKNKENVNINKKVIKNNLKTKKNILNEEKTKKKTLTNSLYVKLFTEMKKIFGPNCGWAQTILFVSELKRFI